jgi:hypothetical protein
METCEECRYFRLNRKSGVGPDGTRTVRGNCLRYPPKILVLSELVTLQDSGAQVNKTIERNPVVRQDGWCGEFKQK